MLLEPPAQQPIVVGGLVGERDAVTVDRLDQRQAVLGVHAKVQLYVAERADLASQSGKVSVGGETYSWHVPDHGDRVDGCHHGGAQTGRRSTARGVRDLPRAPSQIP